ncbi:MULTISPECIES: GAF and ANTAR domain-containing protein [Streptomyces]|uniref:GAF and ANTAR domain-containing protein n=1 Tax=Streptomyces TaxID=1883 RepID=UPI001E4121D3|nr:GAF and ANTAR domain-containing protein [Streptomyces ruber]
MADALIDLADVLAADFDQADFLYRVAGHCMDLLDISDAGVMLAAPGERLRLVAASSERMRPVELFELDAGEGPCCTAYHDATPVDHTISDAPQPRWPRFTSRAHRAGYLSVHAVPIRRREDVIGVLNLFRALPGALPEEDRHLARTLADATAISLTQRAALDHHRTLNRQLQHALDSRTTIEQAKGFLAATAGTDVDAAFQRMRAHARRHQMRLADLARAIVAGTIILSPPGAAGDQPSGPTGEV